MIFKKLMPAKPEYPFKSQLEKNIYNEILTKFPNIKILVNKKGLIKSHKNFELDLYFPQYKLGLEIQGPTHVADINTILKDYKKQDLFSKEGIRIMYIYINLKNKSYSIRKCIEILNNEMGRYTQQH